MPPGAILAARRYAELKLPGNEAGQARQPGATAPPPATRAIRPGVLPRTGAKGTGPGARRDQCRLGHIKPLSALRSWLDRPAPPRPSLPSAEGAQCYREATMCMHSASVRL